MLVTYPRPLGLEHEMNYKTREQKSWGTAKTSTTIEDTLDLECIWQKRQGGRKDREREEPRQEGALWSEGGGRELHERDDTEGRTGIAKTGGRNRGTVWNGKAGAILRNLRPATWRE